MPREFTQSRSRLAFLDWLRGAAALIMLQGHVFHSFTRPDQREHGLFMYSQFLGGQAAAVFLFLTGITFALGIDRRSHLRPWRRVAAALLRARYLFLLAILFRLQLYVFGWGHTQLADLLQVDALNIMGVTTALLSVVALFRDPLSRFRWAAFAGVVIAGLSPVMSNLATSPLPRFLRDYIVPGVQFSVFPWGAYIAFGLACGSLIPLVSYDSREEMRTAWSKVVLWCALAGFTLLWLGRYCGDLPYSIYPHADFWIDSPALVACKIGITFLMGAAAFVWTEYLSPGPSFVRLLGTTSLAVYWVHIELVYGNSLWFWKESLGVWQSAAAVVGVVVLMTAMSWAIHRISWREWFRTVFIDGRLPLPDLDAA